MLWLLPYADECEDIWHSAIYYICLAIYHIAYLLDFVSKRNETNENWKIVFSLNFIDSKLQIETYRQRYLIFSTILFAWGRLNGWLFDACNGVFRICFIFYFLLVRLRERDLLIILGEIRERLTRRASRY